MIKRDTVKITQHIIFPVYKLIGMIFRLKVISNAKEIHNKVLIVSNHITWLDPFLIVAQFNRQEIKHLIPIRTITANRVLYGHPLGPMLRLIGCFPSRPRKGRTHGLEAAIKYTSNSSLIFFPQGGIKGNGPHKRLRTGAAVIAAETGIPILPIHIKRVGIKFSLVRGNQFYGNGLTIEEIMAKVWRLDE